MRACVVFNNAFRFTIILRGVTGTSPSPPSTKIITSCWLLATIYSICIIGELLFVTFHDDTEEEKRRRRGGPNLDARWEWVMNVTFRQLYPLPRQKPWYTQKEAGWAPTPVWKGFGEEKILCPQRGSNRASSST